jgi:hypothetical protein
MVDKNMPELCKNCGKTCKALYYSDSFLAKIKSGEKEFNCSGFRR